MDSLKGFICGLRVVLCFFNKAGGPYNAEDKRIHINRASRSYSYNRTAAVHSYARPKQSQRPRYGSGVQGQS